MAVHIIFLLGIFFAIAGWYCDKALHFDWLLSRILPDYFFAQEAFNSLAANKNAAITKNHEGFNILLEKWPNLCNKESIEYIGRTQAYTSHGPTVKNDFQLVPLDNNENAFKERWSFSEASSLFEEIIENKLIRKGMYFFWCGLIVSIISYILS